jgi:hypothetical protein
MFQTFKLFSTAFALATSTTPVPVNTVIDVPKVTITEHLDGSTRKWSYDEIQGLISHYSALYGVSRDLMDKIIECETAGTYDPKIQSGHYKNGIREDSWGLVQIHLPAHPTITKEMAKNPNFAIDFLAKNLADSKQEMWTCYSIVKQSML